MSRFMLGLNYHLVYRKKEYENDESMFELLDELRSATDFNVETGEQNGAIWSSKSSGFSGNTNLTSNITR